MVILIHLSLPLVLGTYTVISPNPQNDTKCQDSECFLLHDLSTNPHLFFKENATLYFSPGVHIGDNVNGQHLVVSDIAGITLFGDHLDQSIIHCTGKFGLAFVNVTNLKLWNLQFVDCGANLSQPIINRTSAVSNFNPDSAFRATIFMMDVLNVEIWAIDIYYSINSSGIVGVNVVGFVSLGYSRIEGNSVNLMLLTDDTAMHLVYTYIRIEQNCDFWRSDTNGIFIQFQQQMYGINLELQNAYVRANYVGIELKVDLCHNSINIDKLKSTYNFDDHMVLDLWSSHCSETGEFLLLNSHFYLMDSGITVRNYGELMVISPSHIAFVNLTFQDVLSPLSIHNIPNITLQNINITDCSGVVITHENSNITYTGHNFIWNNDGAYYGIMFVWKSNVTFQGHTQFYDNTGFYAGVAYIQGSNIIFDRNSITTFINNHGNEGGAMALYELSLLDIRPNATVIISHNTAQTNGGGVYVDENDGYVFLIDSLQQVRCFFQPSLRYPYKEGVHGNMIFTNNTAGEAGNELFGGWGDICIHYIPSLNLIEEGGDYFNLTFHFSPDPNDISSIASKPSRVCICMEKSSLPNCSITQYNTTSYPGTTVHLSVVTVGQRFGVVPGIVTSMHSGDIIPTLQQFQETLNHCTDVHYTVSSSNPAETLPLLPQDRTSIYGDLNAKLSAVFGIHKNDLILSLFAVFKVNVFLLPCPIGFVLDAIKNICDCHSLLKEYAINCSIEIQKVYRRAPLWIYGLEDGVIVHEHCPLGYCKPGSFNIDLERPDAQCAFHRSGFLCGGCQVGYSQVLGSSVCTQCSNWSVLLVVPFALAGLALVVAIVVLNTTVSVGLINGLLFYANILQANQDIFFLENSKDSFTSVIIAWLNLDFGIKACFFDGMDAYTKTWLQPLFPIYIWTIVIVMIVASHYSIRAAKLCGRNAVPVLATLFLLSYVKMLRVLTSTLSFTVLKYPNGQEVKVWLYDGNVQYLQGKHIVLLLAVLIITTTITIPYTVFLLFAHVFQSKSNSPLFRFWVPRLIPLIDAHTGPYLVHHRHWTGILLLLRVALVLVFSVNILGDPAINLLAIVIAVLCLFLYLTLFGSMYRNPHLTKVEFLFHANLLLTAVVTLYARFTGGNQEIVAHTLVSITLIGFAGILCYHILLALKTSSVWTWMQKLKPVIQENPSIDLEDVVHNDDNEQVGNEQVVPKVLTYSRYREPLDIITDQ